MGPFIDAAAMLTELLVEGMPVPLDLAEVQRAGVHKLAAVLGVNEAVAARLQTIAVESDNVTALGTAMAADDELSELAPRIADEKVCQRRMQEAFAVVDGLFATSSRSTPKGAGSPWKDSPGAGRRESCGRDGSPKNPSSNPSNASDSSEDAVELWQMSSRKPAADWPPYAQLAFRLCTKVLSVACELVAKSSQRSQMESAADSEAPCVPSDLHAANLLFPMLARTLQATASSQLGRWQKRVGWHAARKVASMLSDALGRPPARPPGFEAVAQREVAFADGQRLAILVAPSSRMGGSEGSTRLAVVPVPVEGPRVAGGSDAATPAGAQHAQRRGGCQVTSLFGHQPETRLVRWDECSQIVLPWHEPRDGVIDEVLQDAQKSYDALQELIDLRGLVPGSGFGSGAGHLAKKVEPEETAKGSRPASPLYSDEDDEQDGGRRAGGANRMDSAADSVMGELRRLLQKSIPLRAVIQHVLASVQSAKQAVATARVEAQRAEEAATKAAEDEEVAIEMASAKNASAKMAEETAAAAAEKAAAANAEKEMADAKAKEASNAADKVAEAAAKLRGKAGGADKNPRRGAAKSLTEVAVEEANKVAERANANAEAAGDADKQAAQVAATLRATANEKAQAAKDATRAKERALADAEAARAAASEDMLCKALLAAVGVDRQALEAQIEAWAWERLCATGGAGVRAYAAGQRLVVCEGPPSRTPRPEDAWKAKGDGEPSSVWTDVTVLEPPPAEAAEAGANWHRLLTKVAPSVDTHLPERHGRHRLARSDGTVLQLALHPWNHGVLDLPADRFEVMRKRHARTMHLQHATLVDAISGQRLDVLEQCVPIKVGSHNLKTAQAERADADGERLEMQRLFEQVSDVASLAAWMQTTHAKRSHSSCMQMNACVLLTAGPASGKSTLMSQLVTHMLHKSNTSALVPIIVRVQKLQLKLQMPELRSLFSQAWNFVDGEHCPPSTRSHPPLSSVYTCALRVWTFDACAAQPTCSPSTPRALTCTGCFGRPWLPGARFASRGHRTQPLPLILALISTLTLTPTLTLTLTLTLTHTRTRTLTQARAAAFRRHR